MEQRLGGFRSDGRQDEQSGMGKVKENGERSVNNGGYRGGTRGGYAGKPGRQEEQHVPTCYTCGKKGHKR